MKLFRKKAAIAFALICSLVMVAPIAWSQQNNDAAEFLRLHEPELKQEISMTRRLYLLQHLSPAALAANDLAKAQGYAEELMSLGQSQQNKPGFGPSIYGNSTHVGNIVLGKIALMNGDVNSAKQHLLAAARISGSPTLSSFGPDMHLAKELFERGEREVVISYFDLCAQFWTNDRGKLQQWKDAVSKGIVPNFGANLTYIFDSWRFAK